MISTTPATFFTVFVDGGDPTHFPTKGELIAYLAGEGQADDRVIASDPDEGWCRDVSEDIAGETVWFEIDRAGDLEASLESLFSPFTLKHRKDAAFDALAAARVEAEYSERKDHSTHFKGIGI